MKIILITGTKGKTTLSFMLHETLLSMNKNVLCINSEGIMKNRRTLKNNEYFLKKFETSANVAAIKEVVLNKLLPLDYVIIESSYSSGKNISNSFAKNNIDIAILTNVYWDHIDGKHIKNQKELFQKKLALLKNTKKNGSIFVYTGDKKNSLSYKAIAELKNNRPDLHLFSYNTRLSYNQKQSSINKCYLKNKLVYFNTKPIFNKNHLKSSFLSSFDLYNLSLISLCGILHILNIDPRLAIKKNAKLLAPGRMNLFIKNGYTVFLDYAHEIKSLSSISRFLKNRFKDKQIKAVVRFSYYRKMETIKKLTSALSPLFDSYIIYDKAMSRPSLKKVFTYNKIEGEVAREMYKVLKNKKVKVEIIFNELEAIKKSIKKLKKEEVLYIIGDQINKDIKTIKKELVNKKS